MKFKFRADGEDLLIFVMFAIKLMMEAKTFIIVMIVKNTIV